MIQPRDDMLAWNNTSLHQIFVSDKLHAIKKLKPSLRGTIEHHMYIEQLGGNWFAYIYMGRIFFSELKAPMTF